MIPLPDNEWRRIEVLASWVELSALAEDDGFVPRGHVLNCFNDSSLFVDKKAASADASDSSTEGTAAATVADIWRTLRRRQQLVANLWPFDLAEDSLTRREGCKKLPEVVAYTTMLLIEAAASGWYKSLKIAKSDRVRAHFETIVACSLARVCGGRATRFGAPFPSDWPKKFPARVKYLADGFGVRAVAEELRKLASKAQQDGSLDVVVRWKIGDEDAASPYLLVQCATGKTWKKTKLGEPKMTLWGKFVSWNGPCFRVIAVPFVVRGENELYGASVAHEWAIILDRLRIATGEPDKGIDAELRKVLVDWCKRMLVALPAKAA
jgi:hypothetical protein